MLFDITHAQPTPGPTTAQPTTSNPTLQPTSSAPTTHSPIAPGMGYCSHNPAMQCSSIADCNGCPSEQRRQLRQRSETNNNNQNQDHRNNLRWHRNLAKPECNDGTCRKTCADCSATDPECDPTHQQSCVVQTPPPTPSPTPPPSLANPTGQPTNAVRIHFLYYMF